MLMDTDLVSLNCTVNIQLTEDDYRATEGEGRVEIVVYKDARIATNVSLTVTPMTLSEARRLNVFPTNVVPADDNEGRSPVEAGIGEHILLHTNLTFINLAIFTYGKLINTMLR